jgi:tetratricopeptide (TPR) repeat protein
MTMADHRDVLRTQAQHDFQEAIRRVPNYVDAYVRRAQVLSAMNRLDEAVLDLEKAGSLGGPGSLAVHRDLGLVYHKMVRRILISMLLRGGRLAGLPLSQPRLRGG